MSANGLLSETVRAQRHSNDQRWDGSDYYFRRGRILAGQEATTLGGSPNHRPTLTGVGGGPTVSSDDRRVGRARGEKRTPWWWAVVMSASDHHRWVSMPSASG